MTEPSLCLRPLIATCDCGIQQCRVQSCRPFQIDECHTWWSFIHMKTISLSWDTVTTRLSHMMPRRQRLHKNTIITCLGPVNSIIFVEDQGKKRLLAMMTRRFLCGNGILGCLISTSVIPLCIPCLVWRCGLVLCRAVVGQSDCRLSSEGPLCSEAK